MRTVRVIQRFHSLFYTPQFVTLHLGAREREELRVEVATAESGEVSVGRFDDVRLPQSAI
jgi:hypothetical protein